MAKGFFTAGACVLFERSPGIEALAAALAGAGIEADGPLHPPPPWQLSGPCLGVWFRREVSGYVRVDLIDRPWPDDLGRGDNDQTTVAAADRLAAFGPFTFPGSLARAARSTWGWPEGATVPERHKAFARVRASYMVTADPNQRQYPPDYDPVGELGWVVKCAAAVATAPGALAYFNPGGELLKSPEQVAQSLALAGAMETPPIDLISGLRAFELNNGWVLMDTFGNAQFSHPDNPKPMHDFELCAPREQFDFKQAGQFLVYSTLQLVRNGPIDCPTGQSGSALVRRCGLAGPPRPTVRFFHGSGTPAPPELLRADHELPLL